MQCSVAPQQQLTTAAANHRTQGVPTRIGPNVKHPAVGVRSLDGGHRRLDGCLPWPLEHDATHLLDSHLRCRKLTDASCLQRLELTSTTNLQLCIQMQL